MWTPFAGGDDLELSGTVYGVVIEPLMGAHPPNLSPDLLSLSRPDAIIAGRLVLVETEQRPPPHTNGTVILQPHLNAVAGYFGTTSNHDFKSPQVALML